MKKTKVYFDNKSTYSYSSACGVPDERFDEIAKSITKGIKQFLLDDDAESDGDLVEICNDIAAPQNIQEAFLFGFLIGRQMSNMKAVAEGSQVAQLLKLLGRND